MNPIKKLDYQFLEEISLKIIHEEFKEKDLVGTFTPTSMKKYYQKILSTKKDSLLKKISYLTMPLNCPGFYIEKDQEITVFISYFQHQKTPEEHLATLIFTCFHEARHLYQSKKIPPTTLVNYLSIIEQKIRLIDIEDDYQFNHDAYSYEIGANLYGISKTKKYMQKNYPNEYQKLQSSLEKLEKKYTIDYFNYDAIDTINRYILLSRKSNKEKIKNKNDLDPISKIFLNNDYSCKKIKDIIQNKEFSSLEKELIYSFIATDEFLKSISTNTLTNEEITLLINSLTYALTLYQNQRITLKKYQLEKEIPKNFLTQKIIKIYQELNNIIIGKEKAFRNEKRKKNHQKNIHTYLNLVKTKKEK